MSSTYSSNLRLELISSGEQSSTWGNTTNTNLGTLIEEALTGIVEIDISSGNKTLTALNGAFDQARAMVIVATGSAGVTRSIITPANVSKVYIVDNSASSDIEIVTAASGSPVSVAIPAGTAKFVYTDGTDFFEGSNAADAFTANTITADTVTISGTPTASTDAATVGYVNSAIGTLNTFTASRAIVSNGSGNLAASSATATEVGYLSGVTSAIQTQLNGKQAAGSYAPATSGTSILKGNGSGGFSNASAGADYAPATSGSSILYGNGSGGFSNVTVSTGLTFAGGTLSATGVSPIPTNTKMLFAQAAPPVGWTQVTTYNNYAMRIVSSGGGGTGGSVGFTTAFTTQGVAGSVSVSGGTVGGTAITEAQMPAHAHSAFGNGFVCTGNSPGTVLNAVGTGAAFNYVLNTGSTGGGQAHTHGFTPPTASFSGTSINLAVQYLDIIIASKD